MIRPMWKLISIFLALGVFLTVGGLAVSAGEELIWIVGKAVIAFVVAWFVLGFLGNALVALLERQDGSSDSQ